MFSGSGKFITPLKSVYDRSGCLSFFFFCSSKRKLFHKFGVYLASLFSNEWFGLESFKLLFGEALCIRLGLNANPVTSEIFSIENATLFGVLLLIEAIFCFIFRQFSVVGTNLGFEIYGIFYSLVSNIYSSNLDLELCGDNGVGDLVPSNPYPRYLL